MPPDPPRAFFILELLQNNSGGKKLRMKKCQKLVHLPKKISECTADMKTFFKRPFTSFSGLTSLYLVNIQPNSKFHPSTPPKFSGSAPDCGIEFFLELPSLKHAGSAPVVVLWTFFLYSTLNFIADVSTLQKIRQRHEKTVTLQSIHWHLQETAKWPRKRVFESAVPDYIAEVTLLIIINNFLFFFQSTITRTKPTRKAKQKKRIYNN